MDEQLEQRRRIGQSPFDRDCLYVECIPITKLRIALLTIVNTLRELSGDAQLFRFDDWHEHDGYVTSRFPTSWQSMTDMLASDLTLCAAIRGELYVRNAIYPEDFSFLLRIHVLDELDHPQNYCGIWGDFDLSGSPLLIDRVQPDLSEELGDQINLCNAHGYFDQRYSG